MGRPVRLHVGSGDKYFPGWVNCDLHGEQDMNCDVVTLPFESSYADEIHAYHVIEHLHRKQATEAVSEWYRVLKGGGRVVLEMPCLDKIVDLIKSGERNMRLTLFGLFGDPRDPKPDMLHKWCYSQSEMTELLTGVGFRDVKVLEPVFHLGARDFRVEGVK
jgi:predicted SAM-dependent methyltransferase